MKTKLTVLSVAIALITASLAEAHHSYAMFDPMQELTLHGTIKAVEWTTPHVWIWIVREGDSSKDATYGLETVSPGELVRFFGWQRGVLAVGDKVMVVYAPLRIGRHGGAVRRIVLPDGRVLETPLALRPPAPPARTGTDRDGDHAKP